TQYNLPVVTRLGSGINAERLVRALENVINAHPYIKTRLVQIDGDVMQVRRDNAAATVSFNELDCEPEEAFFQSLTRPFDLFDENLYRIGVYRSPEALWLYVDIHHIVYDGASSGLFMRDLARAYAGDEIQAERFTSFEYSLTEQALMRTVAYQEAEKHFDAVIGGMDATLYPTSTRLDNTVRHTDTATLTVASDVITAFCRRNGITPANHFLATLLQVLRRVTREDGVLITTIHNGRDDARMQESYGMLVKTLPVSLTGNDCKATFTECALAIQRQVAESADRSIYPFTHIVSRHGIHPNILYAYQGLQDYVSAGDSELLAGAESISLELDTAKLPLSLDVKPSSEGFELVAEYDTAMYCRADVDTLLSMIGQTALNAAASEGAPVKDIPLISEADREKIVRLGEGEKYAYDTEKTWVDLFVGAAAEHSGSVAVADRDRRLTYAELDSMSDAMARILINKGVKPNDFVAIMLDRTVRFPLAALAVHKAGAAYVPIDKEYPQERIDYMLSDSGASMVIDEKFMDSLNISAQTESEPINLTTLENRAYMIYTSGSTGQP
ncbi:MAG: AMP-binding protein, partial [Bacteroidales bacterium]|nr:AMP-binding protein [Bacteroidales bacterium]